MEFRLPGPPAKGLPRAGIPALAGLGLVIVLAGLTGCSGGGAADASLSSSCAGARVNAVCLDACSLGCRGSTCEITEIAQNENIVLRFSRAIDPATVGHSTIQFRTGSGEQPEGDFLVNGQVVEFVPRVLVVGAQSFFGFRGGSTYTMTLPGGADEPNALRSTSGDPLRATFSCTLNVSRGVVDLNGVPPAARLIVPATVTNVAQDTTIKLEFNEIIDETSFQGATGANGPIVFAVQRTRDIGGGQRECIRTADPVPLGGSPRVDVDTARRVSVVTFQPIAPLPGNICVSIRVTDRVRDLSGKPAVPQVFEFLTVPTALVQQEIVEDFEDDENLDRNKSAGDWADFRGTFGRIGGDGRHGTFSTDLASRFLGSLNGIDSYEFNTDDTRIPGENTLNGNPAVVTDGRYFFDEMVVPSNVRLVFVGNDPPLFTVRGLLRIDGAIDIQGQSVPYPEPGPQGFAGGAGGIFGGAGGDGGQQCLGVGASPNFNGRHGADCSVPAGHAFAGQVAGTGGRGSLLFPASGLNSEVLASFPAPPPAIGYCMLATAGGGGGGLLEPGGTGRVVTNPVPDPSTMMPPNPAYMGPQAAGGMAIPLFPIPANTRSSLHFVVGGAGGGGGGSHIAFNISIQAALFWARGAGGGGGGGAIALRAGDLLRIDPTARVLAHGGSAGVAPAAQVVRGSPAPGGGGSGGSILLQSGRVADVLGRVDVRGGTAGVLDRVSPTSSVPVPGMSGRLRTEGGAGSPGMLRLELPVAPTPGALPGAQPTAGPNNVGPLLETDTRTGFQSRFLSTGQPFGPEFARYEITALVDGNTVVFSDDPAVGVPARPGLAPIEALWQGATMDLATNQVIELSEGPWRTQVGNHSADPALNDDGKNAVRFLILLDRTNGVAVEIVSVKVVYRV